MDHRNALERAARHYQIDLEYSDTWGHRHVASDDALCAVLETFGIPTATPQELDHALNAALLQEWSRPFPSTLVVREGADSIRLNIPESRGGSSAKLEFQWENGDLEHHWFWLPELRELDRATLSDQTFLAKRVPLPVTMKLGYHQLRILWMEEPELEIFGEAHFIVCPAQARTLDRRIAGLALSLYGVKSSRNWGVGDFTDLLALADAFGPAGVEFLALNPLHAIANRQPFNTSPYLPECSLYRNFLYLDVERVPGFDPAIVPVARIEELRAAPLVEYESVARLKLAALRPAFEAFLNSGHTGGFEEFCRQEGQSLELYAIYCALYEEIHAAQPDTWLWTDWPLPLRDPASAEVAAWAAAHRIQVDFYKFLQWQVDRQLADAQTHALRMGMSIGLYHDVALATDRFGADLWANRPFYRTGARVGAPPDELAPGGQDWGFPPPDRDAHRANGYELFVQLVRNNARHGGALRIDHVMRFFRLFWIPDDLTALQGTYVRDYADNLIGILALESVRNNFIVIGEDLGTVEFEIRRKLGETGIYGYRLMWFEKNLDGSFRQPHEYPEHAAVSTTTHDLATLEGFKTGRDIEARKAAGLVDEPGYQSQWVNRRAELERLNHALDQAGCPGDPLMFILKTPSVLAIVNEQDLTGETEQQNLPASTWQHPNWRRKMLVSVEDLAPLVENLRTRIEGSGRNRQS